jgi:hypothetical protein
MSASKRCWRLGSWRAIRRRDRSRGFLFGSLRVSPTTGVTRGRGTRTCANRERQVLGGKSSLRGLRLQIKYTCSDMELLRNRVKQLDQEIERKLQDYEVAKLLTTLAASEHELLPAWSQSWATRAGSEMPPRWQATSEWCNLRQSGERAFSGASGLPLGNARLRHRLWMPILVAVRKNPWLRALRPPLGCRQATEGRDRGLHAQIAHCHLQRSPEPATVRVACRWKW